MSRGGGVSPGIAPDQATALIRICAARAPTAGQCRLWPRYLRPTVDRLHQVPAMVAVETRVAVAHFELLLGGRDEGLAPAAEAPNKLFAGAFGEVDA